MHKFVVSANEGDTVAACVGQLAVAHIEPAVGGAETVARDVVHDGVFEPQFFVVCIGRVTPYAECSAVDVGMIDVVAVARRGYDDAAPLVRYAVVGLV